jgi:mRNA interferase RelE/StbE
MKILYTNSFSKDLDRIRHQAKIKKRLLELIDKIKQIGSLADLNDVRKIVGYQGYYRIRVGDYRLGIKVTENSIEMVRFLHRKEIYRRFP